MSTPLKLLVIGHVWPEPSATAAGRRMMQLLQCFSDWGYEINFASAAAKTEYSVNLTAIGIQEIQIVLNDSEFDNIVLELNPNIVIFDRFMTEEQYGWRVSETIPAALRILNTEDLHSLRDIRGKMHKERRSFISTEWLQSNITKRELASIYRSDLSLVISHFEIELLKSTANIPEAILMYLPFLQDEKTVLPESKILEFNQRKDFVFIGNGKHLPNVDAVQWLKSEIWPLIHREIPDSNLHIYGAYLPDKIRNFHNPKDRFHVHGWAQSSEEVVSQARVNLVPLRFGAGIKGKIVEAMACGTPNVATSIGWEGFQLSEKNNIKIADEGTAFARTAVELYTDLKKWKNHQKVQSHIYRNSFNKTAHTNNLNSQVSYLLQNLKSHRQDNIVGSLLMHQSMASTKYMSRWIEAKNQLRSNQ